MNDQICPGCDAPSEGYPERSALSRFDNRTPICSDCGRKEGLAQARAVGEGRDPHTVIAAPGVLREELS